MCPSILATSDTLFCLAYVLKGCAPTEVLYVMEKGKTPLYYFGEVLLLLSNFGDLLKSLALRALSSGFLFSSYDARRTGVYLGYLILDLTVFAAFIEESARSVSYYSVSTEDLFLSANLITRLL